MTLTTRFLTLPAAAKAAHRSERTIRRYIDEGLLNAPADEPREDRLITERGIAIGQYREDLVLAAEATKRARRGRPRKEQS